jgi:hypothetical protein
MKNMDLNLKSFHKKEWGYCGDKKPTLHRTQLTGYKLI